MILSALLGMLVGLVLGVTGAGGGILAVPALVFGMGWTMQQSAPVALIAVAAGAAAGAAEGFRKRLVRYRAAALMALAALPLEVAGQRLAQDLPQRGLLILFAGVLLAVALRLLRSREPYGASGQSAALLARVDEGSGRIRWTWPVGTLIAGIGAAAGLATGMLGVGGGFVIVPMLRRFTTVTMHGIVATSLLVVAIVSGAGVAIALLRGNALPGRETLWFAAATVAGMTLGRGLAGRLPAKYVQQGFAFLLIAVAIVLLVRVLR
jgi:uncharacterized membrane protein YfcA